MTEATQTKKDRDPVALLKAMTEAIEAGVGLDVMDGDLNQPVGEDGIRGTVKIGLVVNGEAQIPAAILADLDAKATALGYALQGNPAYGRIPGYPELRGIVLTLEEDLTWDV